MDQWEVYCWISGPIEASLFDFLQLTALAWLGSMVLLHFLAFGSMIMDMWRMDWWGVWWSPSGSLHRNMLGKIETIIEWTWESNPGPVAFSNSMATNWAARFIWSKNKQWLIYVIKSNIPGNKKNTRVILNRPIRCKHVVIFFLKNCRFFTCGFYPQVVS